MNYRFFIGLSLGAMGCHLTSRAQANWHTKAVRKELGYEVVPREPASPPPFPTQEYTLKTCRIVSATVTHFDTVATYAQGRVVDARSHRPLKAVLI